MENNIENSTDEQVVQQTAEIEQEEVKTEEVKDDLIGDLVSLLDGIEGAPDRETVELWKQEYKDLFVLPISETDIYVYRKITRKEYRDIQTLPDVVRKANPDADDESLIEEIEDRLCEMAVLFPSNVQESLASSGGLAKTLTDRIYIASCLLPPEITSQIVIKI